MDEFVTRLNSLKNLKAKQKRMYDIIGTVRLIIFLAGTVLAITFFRKENLVYGYLSIIIFLFIFILFVIQHNHIKKNLERINYKIKINENYIDRMEGNWIHFNDSGEDFTDSGHPYSSDLDLFGLKSLFQWINVSNTFSGREILSDFLKNPDKNLNSIKMRQGAVKEMAKKLDFCQELQCEGMLSPGVHNNPEDLISYSENSSELFKEKWIVNVFYMIPFTTIFTIALFYFKFPISVYIPFVMILIQAVITVIGYVKVLPILRIVYKFKTNIEAYKNIIKLIEKENFKDPYLSELKSIFLLNNKYASAQINSLERIVDAIDLRYNPIAYFILNILLLWDYHCVFALEEWKRRNSKLIRKWIFNIGYFEAVSSLAAIIQINPEWIFPDFIEKDLKFSAVNLGHPLILKSKRVSNDIGVKNNICIVTGSNMSGKTTLLRTIGINLVLAYSGAPVCASELNCSIMNIFTSMRVSDDLNSGISTFYAELLRIKMIIEYSKKKFPMIFLIDEIFRGTNSRDRVIGARSMLLNLSKKWIIGMISTHDFELCDLEHVNGIKILNYHFTESYLNNRIKFDYKLLPGRCNTTNAKYLMRMVGIELIEQE